VLLFGTALLALQMWGTEAWAGPRATIVGEKLLDAGSIEPTEVLQYEFTLRNDGDATLAIEDLQPTCYCVTASTTLWDIPAGGTATIHVRIDPSDFVGDLDKGVEILTNDPDTPVLLVGAKIHVRPGIAVVPPELDFGAVGADGSSQGLKVDIKVPRDRDLEITKVVSQVDYMTAEWEPLELEDRYGASVWVDVLAGAPAGAFKGTVVVHTSDTSLPTIEIPVHGRGPGGLSAAPEKVVFASASAGSEVGSFDVHGGSDLKVSSSSSSLLAQLETVAESHFRVKLSLAKEARAGRLMAKVIVSTPDGSHPDLTVPVMGIVR
jgi:hypothetical protein